MEKKGRIKKGLKTLGWLVAFPVPVTKALAKKKGGKVGKKAATIAATWAMYLGLATAGVSAGVNRWNQPVKEPQETVSTDKGQDSDRGNDWNPEDWENQEIQTVRVADNEMIVVDVGERIQLSSKLIDSGKPVNYYLSMDPPITVDEKGVVTGIRYGICAVTISSDGEQSEYVNIWVAKHRSMKLSTKIVREDGEFREKDWDVKLLIDSNPCEDGDYIELWANENNRFTVQITNKETGEEGRETINTGPALLSIIDGYQVMVPVTIKESGTSFRVYFHFDGNVFKASNELIFGKTSWFTVELIYDSYMRVGASAQPEIRLTSAAEITTDDISSLVFESSNESVVTVDENGKVTAVGSGEAYIVAYSEETGDWGYTTVFVN